jgi:hypothetical protein
VLLQWVGVDFAWLSVLLPSLCPKSLEVTISRSLTLPRVVIRAAALTLSQKPCGNHKQITDAASGSHTSSHTSASRTTSQESMMSGLFPSVGQPKTIGSLAAHPAVFSAPEEEYKYITRHSISPRRKVDAAANKAEERGEKHGSRMISTSRGSNKKKKKKRGDKAKGDTTPGKKKKKGKKGKKGRAEGEGDWKKECASAGRPSLSQGNDAVYALGSFSENGGVASWSSSSSSEKKEPPKLRKAASFLFNKTSDVRAYFRKLASEDTSKKGGEDTQPTARPPPPEQQHQQQRQHHQTQTEKRKPRPNTRNRLSALSARHQSHSSASASLQGATEGMASEESEKWLVTFDPRYTDAVLFCSSSVPVAPNRWSLTSDHETLSIMIEEDTATNDSPTMLPCAASSHLHTDHEEDDPSYSGREALAIRIPFSPQI